MDFNPHHHAGGDVDGYGFDVFCNISIHTTTQVVTAYESIYNIPYPISIHTTTQVVTQRYVMVKIRPKISIHTTTQVVTQKIGISREAYQISIHTTTQVVTQMKPWSWTCSRFQSTPPRRW